MLPYYKKTKVYLSGDYSKSLLYICNELKRLENIASQDQDFIDLISIAFYNSNNIPFDVYNFVRNNISYRTDYYDETLISPQKILGLKYGDCDDMALLTKSILNVLGIDSDYYLLGKNENEFTHIVVITKNGIVIDPTNTNFNVISDAYKYYKKI
jgi:uncharacterized membrane protein